MTITSRNCRYFCTRDIPLRAYRVDAKWQCLLIGEIEIRELYWDTWQMPVAITSHTDSTPKIAHIVVTAASSKRSKLEALASRICYAPNAPAVIAIVCRCVYVIRHPLMLPLTLCTLGEGGGAVGTWQRAEFWLVEEHKQQCITETVTVIMVCMILSVL